MKVRFKKLTEDAVIPTKAHATDAGFDLVATSKECETKTGAIVYGTGIAVEIPYGYVGLVFPRSSVVKTDLQLTNSVGVIDSGYRGQILCKFKPTPYFSIDANGVNYGTVTPDEEAIEYELGERIAQLVIVPIPEIEFEEAAELSDTERGAGGYGSSGR